MPVLWLGGDGHPDSGAAGRAHLAGPRQRLIGDDLSGGRHFVDRTAVGDARGVRGHGRRANVGRGRGRSRGRLGDRGAGCGSSGAGGESDGRSDRRYGRTAHDRA
jgi:hypothetical protein